MASALVLLIALLVAAPAPGAAQVPVAFERVGCFNMPLFYGPGATELSGEDRRNFDVALAWLTRDPVLREVRVVLRHNTRENPREIPTVLVMDGRAQQLRELLISKGIAQDRILIADEMWGDTDIEKRFDLKGFEGGWIVPEFYLTPATAQANSPSPC